MQPQSDNPSGPVAPGLEDLLALATPMDTCRGLFFTGVLHAAESLGGAAVRETCFQAMGQKRFVDFFSYPVADFLRAIFTVCEQIGPTLGGQDAVMRQLGRRGTMDFLQSTVGKTMLALAGSDPHRLLATIPSACRASLSYGERSVKQVGDHQACITTRRDFLPQAYNEGLITAALEQSTARDIYVRGRRTGLLDVEYDARWS